MTEETRQIPDRQVKSLIRQALDNGKETSHNSNQNLQYIWAHVSSKGDTMIVGCLQQHAVSRKLFT